MLRSRRLLVPLLVTTLVGGLLTAVSATFGVTTAPAEAATPVVPRPDHTVVVMLENKNRTSVIGSTQAPYLNSLAARGANLTQSYGVTHPSQGNYVALFSGSQQGVVNDVCPQSFPTTDNIGAQLARSGQTFVGYSESLPSVGYTGCSAGTYQRKHNSWVDFGTVPASANQPFSAFPTDFTKLPTVAFVTPDMCNDMHDCSVATGDTWMKNKLDAYATWAVTHNSLLVVTFDENQGGTVNQIPTLLVGAMVKPGSYGEQLNHYGLLRTIETAYGLPALGNAATVAPLSTIWTTTPTTPPTTPPANGLTNGGFESGIQGWVGSGLSTTTTVVRHGGLRAATTGFAKGDSILSQTITAPPDTSKLDIWWMGNCHDVASTAWATIIVKRNTSGQVSTLLPKTCTVSTNWQKVSVALTPGHAYTVQLITHDDGVSSTPNVSYFDDVAVS